MAYTTTFWLTVSNQAGTSGFTTSVTGANALPPPSVSDMPAALIGVGTITLFSSLQIINLAASGGANVRLSTPAQGTFGDLGTGSYTVSSGLYSVLGTPA